MAKSIRGVEIFSVGTWNGDTYTQKDLDEMVRAFSETGKTLIPPLKLGHSKEQKILQSDGLPAAGWIGNLYAKGGKLIADFIDIPNKIYDLLMSKAYRKVSAEILWDAELNGKKFKRVLAAVALLGSDMPAVGNLSDILDVHAHAFAEFIKSYASDTDGLTIKAYTFNEDEIAIGGHGMSKTEAEIKLEQDLKVEQDKAQDLSTKLKTYEQDLESNKATLSEKEKEIEELKQYKADAEAKAIEAAKALEETQLEKTLTEMQSEKMISPSMRPYVKALLGEEKKEYSLKNNDKDEKLSKTELLKTILKLFTAASAVNFDESSVDDKVTNEKDEKALVQKINEYAMEHKVSIGTAYKAVLKKATV
jgi:hypothetical protein